VCTTRYITHIRHWRVRYLCTCMGACTCTCTPLQDMTYVELRQEAAAVNAWGCVDNTAHRVCTPSEGTSLGTSMRACTWKRTSIQWGKYGELQHGAAAVHTWGCVDNTAHRVGTPLEGMSLVYVYGCMHVYMYATPVYDVRGAAARGSSCARVGLHGRHSTSRVHATGGYATGVRVWVRARGHVRHFRI
jgi:hypothetical protein